MSYLGAWEIDQLLTFPAQTSRVDTGVATDADSAPTYRIYEDETATPILTGSMATLDAGNTDGFYTERITLSAANGFEAGKCYTIHVKATVNAVAGAMVHTFRIAAAASSGVVRIKKNTACANFPFTLYDAADPTNPIAGATVTATRSLDGAAFAACTNSPTSLGNGVYLLSLSAADLNADTVTLRFTSSISLPLHIHILTNP